MNDPTVFSHNPSAALPNPANRASKLPLILAVTAFLFLLIASVSYLACVFFDWLSRVNFSKLDSISDLLSSLDIYGFDEVSSDVFSWFFCMLFLPLSLLLLNSHPKKALLGKLFLIAALFFIAIQLLAVSLEAYYTYQMLLPSHSYTPWLSYLAEIIDCIPANNLLSSWIVAFYKFSSSNGISSAEFIAYVILTAANLLYILTSWICAIGFAIVGFKTNK